MTEWSSRWTRNPVVPGSGYSIFPVRFTTFKVFNGHKIQGYV